MDCYLRQEHLPVIIMAFKQMSNASFPHGNSTVQSYMFYYVRKSGERVRGLKYFGEIKTEQIVFLGQKDGHCSLYQSTEKDEAQPDLRDNARTSLRRMSVNIVKTIDIFSRQSSKHNLKIFETTNFHNIFPCSEEKFQIM